MVYSGTPIMQGPCCIVRSIKAFAFQRVPEVPVGVQVVERIVAMFLVISLVLRR